MSNGSAYYSLERGRRIHEPLCCIQKARKGEIIVDDRLRLRKMGGI